jgi:hypothetical protein
MRGCLLALALVACQSSAPPPSRQWTMFELNQALHDKANVLAGAEGAPPDGLRANLFVRAEGPVIPISPAYTEGGFSPYITTNLWANTPEVWVQPMYIVVRDWNPTTQSGTPVTSPPTWIFSVGPKSRFHSPFWRVYFAELPPGGEAARYTSAARIIEDGLILHEGPGRLAALAPPGTTSIEEIDVMRPWWTDRKTQLTMPKVRNQDLLDGESVATIDFGDNRFEWNQELEVIEQPFFVLFACKAGNCEMSFLPNVGGTGPLFERRPAIAPNNRPRFGSFWRLYFVRVPADGAAAVLIPPGPPYDDDELHKKIVDSFNSSFDAPALGFVPDATMAPRVKKHFLQVALNGKECFKTAEAFETCQWLDSQAAIEDHLPTAIQRTGIGVTCPFVGYNDAPVPPR